MNVDMVVEPVLCLCKQESNNENANIHHGATSLREIQCQIRIYSYTGTLNVMRAIVVDIFLINDQVKN